MSRSRGVFSRLTKKSKIKKRFRELLDILRRGDIKTSPIHVSPCRATRNRPCHQPGTKAEKNLGGAEQKNRDFFIFS